MMTPATRPAQRHVEARVRAAVRCRRRARRVDLSSALIGRSHVDVVRLVLRAAQSRHLGPTAASGTLGIRVSVVRWS